MKRDILRHGRTVILSDPETGFYVHVSRKGPHMMVQSGALFTSPVEAARYARRVLTAAIDYRTGKA